ncbi:hypothetical protein U1Q18_052831 [Sarracenia purpurea var. burkii]
MKKQCVVQRAINVRKLRFTRGSLGEEEEVENQAPCSSKPDGKKAQHPQGRPPRQHRRPPCTNAPLRLATGTSPFVALPANPPTPRRPVQGPSSIGVPFFAAEPTFESSHNQR